MTQQKYKKLKERKKEKKTLKCKHLSYKKTSLIKNVLFEDNSIKKRW